MFPPLEVRSRISCGDHDFNKKLLGSTIARFRGRGRENLLKFVVSPVGPVSQKGGRVGEEKNCKKKISKGDG